jgi:hypothetical protein
LRQRLFHWPVAPSVNGWKTRIHPIQRQSIEFSTLPVESILPAKLVVADG